MVILPRNVYRDVFSRELDEKGEQTSVDRSVTLADVMSHLNDIILRTDLIEKE